MSSTVSRLILSLALLTSVPALWCALCFPIYHSLGWSWGDEVFLITHLIVACLFMALWILLWKPHISWTSSRAVRTAIAGPLAALPASACGFAVAIGAHADVGFIVGGLFWIPFWLAATAVIWRDRPVDVAAKHTPAGPNCPQCNYNLSGLTQARCPECGTEYTLDQLFAAATSHARLE